MGHTLYIECDSGISGDMTVGALLDIGADSKKLLDVIDSIGEDGFKIEISKVKKAGLLCTDFNVILDDEHDGHDHDMDYLYGHLHEHGKEKHSHIHHHEHAEIEDLEHHHEHSEHEDLGHHHSHRGIKEIYDIIDNTSATEDAKKIAKRIFSVLAEAESKAHGVPVEEVHFHEVGAIDSIVDILAIGVCLDDLDITQVIVPKIFEGQGTVRCQHGILPIPVPAVVNIAAAHDIAMEILPVNGELVTPTGAATIAAIRTSDTLPGQFVIKKVGMGSGKREYGLAGFLRVMIIEEKE